MSTATYHASRVRLFDAAGVERAWRVIVERRPTDELRGRLGLVLSCGGRPKEVRGRVADWMLHAVGLGMAYARIEELAGPVTAKEARQAAAEERQRLDSDPETQGLELLAHGPAPSLGGRFGAAYTPAILRLIRAWQEAGQRNPWAPVASEFGLDPFELQRAYLDWCQAEPILGGELVAWESAQRRRCRAPRLNADSLAALPNVEQRAIRSACASAITRAEKERAGLLLWLGLDVQTMELGGVFHGNQGRTTTHESEKATEGRSEHGEHREAGPWAA